MANIVPIPEDVIEQDIEIALDKERILRIRWNDQLQGYTFDLLDVDETLQLAGIRLTTARDLFEPYRDIPDLDIPAGRLIAVDMSGKGLEPYRGELIPDKRVRLFYDES